MAGAVGPASCTHRLLRAVLLVPSELGRAGAHALGPVGPEMLARSSNWYFLAPPMSMRPDRQTLSPVTLRGETRVDEREPEGSHSAGEDATLPRGCAFRTRLTER